MPTVRDDHPLRDSVSRVRSSSSSSVENPRSRMRSAVARSVVAACQLASTVRAGDPDPLDVELHVGLAGGDRRSTTPGWPGHRSAAGSNGSGRNSASSRNRVIIRSTSRRSQASLKRASRSCPSPGVRAGMRLIATSRDGPTTAAPSAATSRSAMTIRAAAAHDQHHVRRRHGANQVCRGLLDRARAPTAGTADRCADGGGERRRTGDGGVRDRARPRCRR